MDKVSGTQSEPVQRPSIFPGLTKQTWPHDLQLACENQSLDLVAQLVNGNPGVAGTYFLPLWGDSPSENEVNLEESRGEQWNETDFCWQLKPATPEWGLFLELLFCHWKSKKSWGPCPKPLNFKITQDH